MINRTMTITVLYGNGNGLPMPYTVTVSKHGSCRDLIQALANACCLKNDENLLLAEVNMLYIVPAYSRLCTYLCPFWAVTKL